VPAALFALAGTGAIPLPGPESLAKQSFEAGAVGCTRLRLGEFLLEIPQDSGV
jgi:hypothetical protein